MYNPISIGAVGKARQEDILREAENRRLVNLAKNSQVRHAIELPKAIRLKTTIGRRKFERPGRLATEQ